MRLEGLIYGQLTGDAGLVGLLARWDGAPAVFELRAVRGADDAWEDLAEFPRIVFVVDRTADPELDIVGRLGVEIWADGDSATLAAIAARVQALLDFASFRADDGVYGLRLETVTSLEPQDPDDDDLAGKGLGFLLAQYPAQQTYEPDPVEVLSEWTQTKFPALQVDPESWVPTDESPAVYWRMAGATVASRQAAGAWIDASVAGHVHAPSATVRLAWTRRLFEALAVEHEIESANRNLVFLMRPMGADSSADPQREGQIRLVCRFGVDAETLQAPPRQAAPTVQDVHVRSVYTP